MSERVQHDEQCSSLHDRWRFRYDERCSSLHAEGLNVGYAMIMQLHEADFWKCLSIGVEMSSVLLYFSVVIMFDFECGTCIIL